MKPSERIEKEVLNYFGYGDKRQTWDNEMQEDVRRIKEIVKVTQQITIQEIFNDYCKDCSFKSKKYCKKEKCAWIWYMKKWGVK